VALHDGGVEKYNGDAISAAANLSFVGNPSVTKLPISRHISPDAASMSALAIYHSSSLEIREKKSRIAKFALDIG
jgi:hypothetical protein